MFIIFILTAVSICKPTQKLQVFGNVALKVDLRGSKWI